MFMIKLISFIIIFSDLYVRLLRMETIKYYNTLWKETKENYSGMLTYIYFLNRIISFKPEIELINILNDLLSSLTFLILQFFSYDVIL